MATRPAGVARPLSPAVAPTCAMPPTAQLGLASGTRLALRCSSCLAFTLPLLLSLPALCPPPVPELRALAPTLAAPWTGVAPSLEGVAGGVASGVAAVCVVTVALLPRAAARSRASAAGDGTNGLGVLHAIPAPAAAITRSELPSTRPRRPPSEATCTLCGESNHAAAATPAADSAVSAAAVSRSQYARGASIASIIAAHLSGDGPSAATTRAAMLRAARSAPANALDPTQADSSQANLVPHYTRPRERVMWQASAAAALLPPPRSCRRSLARALVRARSRSRRIRIRGAGV